MPTTTKTHRVHCEEWAVETTSEARAQALLWEIDKLGACQHLHTVEVRVGQEWVPVHIARARTILAAAVGAPVETPDGHLVVAERSPSSVLATSDGGTVRGWCECGGPVADEDWVRYERWSERGREAHGYVNKQCRHIIQTG